MSDSIGGGYLRRTHQLREVTLPGPIACEVCAGLYAEHRTAAYDAPVTVTGRTTWAHVCEKCYDRFACPAADPAASGHRRLVWHSEVKS